MKKVAFNSDLEVGDDKAKRSGSAVEGSVDREEMKTAFQTCKSPTLQKAKN